MKKKHSIRIDRKKLHPWLNYKLGLLLKECEKNGIYLIITEGFRTKAYQDSLYEKGRTKPGKIVTNATGSAYSSQHQWGIAFDIAINNSKMLYNDKLIRKVAKIAKSKKIGLKWGGDWKSIVDTPHFYLGKWGSTTSKLKSTYGSFDKFKRTWTGKLRCNTYLRKERLFTSKKLMTIQKGETVRILWKSKVSKVAKIEYAGKYGFIRLKNLA